MAEAKADDCSKVQVNEKSVRHCDVSKKEEEKPTYSDQFPDSKQDASQVIAPIADKVAHATIPMEGTRQLNVKPGKVKAYKSLASYGSCSSLGSVPKVLPSIYTSPKGDGDNSSKLASENDEQYVDAQETKFLDSFVVLDAGKEHGDAKQEKEGEKVTPVGTSSVVSSTSSPRNKRTGVSAFTYALEMEAAKKAVAKEATDTASGSELKNEEDNGDNISGHRLKMTYPRPEDLTWIPCVVWGPDGRRVVKEENEDSEFRADPLETPFRFEVRNGRVFSYFEVPGSPDGSEHSYPIHRDNIVEEEPEPNIWERCYMWCGSKLCCRDYEPL